MELWWPLVELQMLLALVSQETAHIQMKRMLVVSTAPQIFQQLPMSTLSNWKREIHLSLYQAHTQLKKTLDPMILTNGVLTLEVMKFMDKKELKITTAQLLLATIMLFTKNQREMLEKLFEEMKVKSCECTCSLLFKISLKIRHFKKLDSQLFKTIIQHYNKYPLFFNFYV